MKPIEIEAWVLKVVDQVKNGQPNEDSRVELKAEWIEPEKAARQIAGHANAARGATILWIIGLDEKKGVIGADYNNLANWFSAVKSHFDELYPEAIDINVPTDGKMLVALLFETDRAPYVVKNPKGGQVELEVPWRELTKIRTAKRSDLIRLLEPLTYSPAVEVTQVNKGISRDIKGNYEFKPIVRLYIVPRNEKPVYIPFHKFEFSLFAGDDEIGNLKAIDIRYPLRPRFNLPEFASSMITITSSEIIVNGPGMLEIECHFLYVEKIDLSNKTIEVRSKFLPVNAQVPVMFSYRLQSDS